MASRDLTMSALVCIVLAGGCTPPHVMSEPAYLTSEGVAFVPEEGFPVWSWDTVQEFKMFGENTLLTDDEVERIAALSNFVALEKQHGMKDLGAAELGTKHDAARLKAANPDMKVLFYFNGAIPYPFTSYTRDFSPKTEGPSEQVKQDLFLFNTESSAYHITRNGNIYAYDILKPTMRTWWSDTVGEAVALSGTDGVFWDQMHGWAWERPGRREEIERAHVILQQMTRKAMGVGRILLCNNAAENPGFIPNCDAVMYEHFKPGQYREDLQRYVDDWDQMLAVANAGKINVYRWPLDLKGTTYENAHPRIAGAPENHDELAAIAKARITFPLACFLIGAQPYSWFMFSWGWGTYTGALVDFPEMKRPLGPPLGLYQRASDDKWIFTRKFKHADVWVDLEREEAEITWR